MLCEAMSRSSRALRATYYVVYVSNLSDSGK